MEKFIVSARKYRPQDFNSVVGQGHITTTLKNAIRNHQLAHAFLFCGPRGVGKTTCARILAKTINCENITPEGEACNHCNSCVTFNDGASLNIHELDAASNNSVDDIRSLVDQVRFAPQAGKYKVYIVDEVHMLSTSAFNAFLKTLEEPPPYAIFILATTEKHKILPTILSRCQIFDFKRITNNDTIGHLQEIVQKEHIRAEKAALQVIAQKSEGCMRDSLSILDKIVSFTNGEVTYQNTLEHLNILDHDYYFKMLETQRNQDLAGSMLLYDEINRKGFEGDLVLNGYAEFIRNLLVCQNPRAASLLDIVEGLQGQYEKAAKSASPAYLVAALNILNESEINYKQSRNKRLHVEMTMIKLTFLQQAIDLTFDRETGETIKKKRVSGPVAVRVNQVPGLQIKAPEGQIKGLAPAEVKQVYNSKATVTAASTLAERLPVIAISQQGDLVSEETTELRVAKKREVVIAGKKSLLDAVREQQLQAKLTTHVHDPIPLTVEKVEEAWKCFSDKLKEQLKHAVVTVFGNSRLSVIDTQTFDVVVTSSLEQKFIEQEKLRLLEYLKECFCNKDVSFTITIDTSLEPEKPANIPLGSREKFLKLVEVNPWVKDLKDRLQLEY